MRIGIEAYRIFRTYKHGIDIAAIELIKQLQCIDSDNQYFVFAFKDKDDKILQDTANCKIIRLNKIPLPFTEQFMLPWYARKYKLDVVHCTGNTAPLFLNKRLVITLHDIIYLEKLNLKDGSLYQRIGNLYRRIIVPKAVENAQKVITVSNHENKSIAELLPSAKSKTKVVHNACGNHFKPLKRDFLEKIKQEYNLPDEFALFHGNTDPKKNVSNVLKALAVLKEKKQLDFKLVITDLSEKELEKNLSKFNLQPIRQSIQLTGYVPNTILPAFYNLAFAFLYPSKRESFGIPILEAMSCGTPVITAFYSSMSEISGNAALQIDPSVPEQIAAAMHQMRMCEECRQKKIELGFERVKQFSWHESALKVLEVYEQLDKTAA